MKKLFLLCGMTAILAGCGSSDGTMTTSAVPSATTASISGYVADGYLRNAEIFLDVDGDLQWDENEPKTTSGPGGYYRLTGFDPALMQYSVVARAIPGTTVDEDTPNQPVANAYLLCAPAGATEFVSPVSTLVQEKMAANPGMTLTDAIAQVRTDLGLPSGLNLMGDFVAGSSPGQPDQAIYRNLRTMAQQMVGLMGEQSSQVMNSAGADATRYRAMVQTMSRNLPGMYQNAASSSGTQSSFMTTLRSTIKSALSSQAGTIAGQ